MALSQNHNFDRDFLIPSFHANTNLPGSNYPQFLDVSFINSNDTHDRSARTTEPDPPPSRASCNDCESIYRCLSERFKFKGSTLKDKNIGDNGSVISLSRNMNSESECLSSASSSTISQYGDEEADLKTARNEIFSNDRVIDSLNEKYVCLNFEFNQLQERHGVYERNAESKNNVECESAYSDSSENGLERKYTQIFRRRESPVKESPRVRKPSKKHKSQKTENKENISTAQDNNKELKLILKTLKKIFKSPPVPSKDTVELKKLYEIVKTLQEEQEKFRNVIKEQQDQLNSFHSKYIQAQSIIQTQKYEIQQLHNTNQRLENELNINMNALKEKFQDKINEVSQVGRSVKTEKVKAEKLARENSSLITKLQQFKQELAIARAKLEEVGQKRTKTLSKLKSAERDLKIFRTQNNTLKTEKRTLYEELRKLKGLNDDLKTTSSKNISRQRERGETLQRLLRKKILDLELELNQSRNSTNVLVEERDKLIAELHMQLNTLVHNFEVSQKHIRILRRHIYSLSGSQSVAEKNS